MVDFFKQRKFFTTAGLVVMAAAVIFFVQLDLLVYVFSGEKAHIQDDTMQEYLSHAIFRQSVLEYHRFPLWSPYLGGGYPHYAHPRDARFVLPLQIPVLLWGEIRGIKLDTLIIYLVGAVSMFLYARRRFGSDKYATVLATVIYAANARFFQLVLGGNYNELLPFIFPLILLFYDQGRKKLPWLIAAALCMSALIFFGQYSFLYAAFLLLLYALSDSILIAGMLLGVYAFCGHIMEFGQDLYFVLIIINCILLALFAGIYKNITKSSPHFKSVLYFIAFFYFVFFFSLFKSIPMYELLTGSYFGAHRGYYNVHIQFFTLFLIALFAGELLHFLVRLSKKYNNGHIRSVFSAGMALVLGILFYIFLLPRVIDNVKIFTVGNIAETWESYYLADLAVPSAEGSFYHIQGYNLPKELLRSRNSQEYLNFKRGIGTIDWRDDYITVPTRVQPRYLVYADTGRFAGWGSILDEDIVIPNRRYRGEAYFVGGGGEAGDYRVEPDKLKVTVKADPRSTLVINQNYSADWASDAGEVMNHDGLLAVYLGEGAVGTITLSYRPKLFYLCLLFSVIGSLFGIFFIKHNKIVYNWIF